MSVKILDVIIRIRLWHRFLLLTVLIFILAPIPHAARNATAVLPLHAQTGTHHVHLWVGQPPQRQVVIVDTGSRTLALTCSQCRHCGKHTYYDMEASTTLLQHNCQLRPDASSHDADDCEIAGADCNEQGECRVGQKYTEGSSWTALEVNDIIVLGTEHPEDYANYLMTTGALVTFGCQYRLQGMFVDQYADGIMGMEPSDHGIMATLSRQLRMPNMFSLCLTPQGGYLGLGGSLVERHMQRMHYTPLVASSSKLYRVQVVRAWFGEDELSTRVIEAFNCDKGTILDSGTTDTYLPEAMEDGVADAWQKLSGARWKDKYHEYTYEDFRRLPTVKLELEGGVRLEIKPEHYMEGAGKRKWKGTRELRKRLYADERKGAVLGVNAMMGYDVLHDVEHQRVGFARAYCGPKHHRG